MRPSTSKAHGIRVEPSGARVRALFAGAVIADTRRALVLREGSLAPVYYVPLDEVRARTSSRRTTTPTAPSRATPRTTRSE